MRSWGGAGAEEGGGGLVPGRVGGYGGGGLQRMEAMARW